MQAIMQIENLSKHYDNFDLEDVSFSIPYGSIMGLIGANGAGKSTIIKTILGIAHKDSGYIQIFGRDDIEDNAIKEKIGVVFDGSNFHPAMTPKQINKVLADIYTNWQEDVFYTYLKKLSLPEKKKIEDFSRGMKMKLAIASALSHQPELLILDEPTGGLDPIVRDEILDMFLDFIQDERHAILVSSHILRDLEKVADYITFIHNGRLLFSKTKDELIYDYGLIRCTKEQFSSIERDDIIACRRQEYSCDVLTADKAAAQRKYTDCVIDNVTIDDIMLMYIKGERQ